VSQPSRRQALLAAGRLLSAELALEQLDASRLCGAAGLSADAFAAEFADLEDYLVALQQDFMDGLKSGFIAATSGLPPGYERAQRGALSYLDGCLAQRGLRSWLLKARLRQEALANSLQRQNQGYLLILPPEFAALGWPHPAAAVRLFLACLWEIARLEHQAGRASEELRGALWQFLRTYDRR
jgi:TetR/AcrR family transcriptional regulator, transcriptional repressor for nem operon